jgi:hypothetical protein
MKKLIIFFLVVLLPLLSSKSWAQEVISSAGANHSSANLQVSWTIGEPIVETFSTDGIILTQGFHQSKLVVTAIDPIPLAGFDIEVYPNPTSGVVNINMNKGNISKLRFSLYTSQGEQIRQQEFSSQNEQINMQTLAPGYYMLKIVNDKGSPVQTFKIVKY